jgi:SAM-dependent methyltransferase
VPLSFLGQFSRTVSGWWKEQARDRGALVATSLLASNLWEFVRESTPERRKQRYGDMEYDWEHRVNTTCGTVSWRARLLGAFHSPYQPTEPGLFHEMMAKLPIEFTQFTFIDLGSGKGRTLLMAAEYPFQRIVGVELIEELHRAAEENIRAYGSPGRCCLQVEVVLADAREFEFPEVPLLLYLFNPLPRRGLSEVLERLRLSLIKAPRPVWVVYHNALLEDALNASNFLERVGGTSQYSIYHFNIHARLTDDRRVPQ